MKHILEGSTLFPFIAWSCVIGFALFTWTLTIHLKTELASIAQQAESTEYAAQAH